MMPSKCRAIALSRCAGLVALMILAGLLGPAHAQDAEKETVKLRLDKIVADSLKDKKVSDEGKTEFEKAVKRGVDRLANDKFDPDKVKLAETNLKKLVSEAVNKSGDKPIDAPVLKKLVMKGKGADCPYPPFCWDKDDK